VAVKEEKGEVRGGTLRRGTGLPANPPEVPSHCRRSAPFGEERGSRDESEGAPVGKGRGLPEGSSLYCYLNLPEGGTPGRGPSSGVGELSPPPPPLNPKDGARAESITGPG
jgi:hypothetical protein